MDPLQRFNEWFTEAKAADLKVPNAMALSTATAGGCPSVRYILLKDIDQRGCIFFTSYSSRKGREIEENPQAALCVFWQPLDRQVRVVGKIERLEKDESEKYFHTRPRGSQIGAWASQQSELLDARKQLMSKYKMYEERFGTEIIPLPENWGGYRLVPHEIEFWHGAEHRLHIREQFLRDGDQWVMTLRYP